MGSPMLPQPRTVFMPAPDHSESLWEKRRHDAARDIASLLSAANKMDYPAVVIAERAYAVADALITKGKESNERTDDEPTTDDG